jgi:two-component system copper resistance phosphate regulon response regulator CusR
MMQHAYPGRVLLIEAQPDLAHCLVQTLRCQGIYVEMARSGTRGLDMALRQSHDAIIMNAQLGDLESSRIYKLLKSNPQTRDVPIVILVHADTWLPEAEQFPVQAGDYELPTNVFVQHTLVERLRSIDIV